MRLITDIENDIQNKQTELDQTTHEIGRSILINTIADLEIEKKNAEEALSQQERVEAQEAEVESFELPLDFNELLSDGEHRVTKANEMIIEVVKEDRRARNEIHNAEVVRIMDENKANLEALYARHNEVTEQYVADKNDLERRLTAENDQAKLDAAELNKLELEVAQLKIEKQQIEQSKESLIREAQEKDRLYNDACEKRNNATRMLDEANETIESQRNQIERLQATKTNGLIGQNITQTNRLAELAAEANREKAAKGIERWNKQYGTDIPVLATPDIMPVTASTGQDEAATETPFLNQTTEATDTQRDPSLAGNIPMDESLGSNEGEVITLESLHARLKIVEQQLSPALSEARAVA